MATGSEGTVRIRWESLSDTTSPRDGWHLPREMGLDADLEDGVQVHIDVEVVEGRARARSVTVRTDKPHGVGWTALSNVPVRDLVASGVRGALHRLVPEGEGRMVLKAPSEADADVVLQIVRDSVGYNPKIERFLVEVAS
jgi:Family of unknown function (DUF5719)